MATRSKRNAAATTPQARARSPKAAKKLGAQRARGASESKPKQEGRDQVLSEAKSSLGPEELEELNNGWVKLDLPYEELKNLNGRVAKNAAISRAKSPWVHRVFDDLRYHIHDMMACRFAQHPNQEIHPSALLVQVDVLFALVEGLYATLDNVITMDTKHVVAHLERLCRGPARAIQRRIRALGDLSEVSGKPRIIGAGYRKVQTPLIPVPEGTDILPGELEDLFERLKKVQR